MSLTWLARARSSSHGAPQRSTAWIVAPLVLVSLAVAACGEVPARHAGTDAAVAHPGRSGTGGGCQRTVHGVTVGPGKKIVSLPVAPGRIVSQRAAVSAARRSAGSHWPSALAKLSSWAETAALMQRSRVGTGRVPATLTRAPWLPIWDVLLSRGHGASRREALVVVDAKSGKPELATAPSSHGTAWYAALTDRSAAGPACPGGSSSRLPFGVLTRDEESFLAGLSSPAPVKHARTSQRLILSTVPAVNKADNGLYGGCVQQNCSINELVWVILIVVRALPGHTVSCLPGSVSTPPGYKPKQVKQYYSISVPDNYGIGCGPVPRRIRDLKDLAPPGGGAVVQPVRCRLGIAVPLEAGRTATGPAEAGPAYTGTMLPCPYVGGLPGPCRVFVTVPRLDPCRPPIVQGPCDAYTGTSASPQSGSTHVAAIKPRLVCIGGYRKT